MTSIVRTINQTQTDCPTVTQLGELRLDLTDLSYTSILQNISATWCGGQMVGIIGPNGTGKSSLLRVLAGVWAPTAGRVSFNQRSMAKWSAKQRAQKITYLPQQISEECPFTVGEFVEMGRYVHRSRWGSLNASGRQVIHDAIEKMGLATYCDVPLSQLSGGERQRAGVARCLAQESPILLLDEPISNLDVYYQMDILEQLQSLARAGYLVILSIHHLEFAARYCSHLLLLNQGRVYAHGTVDEVLTESAVQDVFQVATKIYRDPFGEYLRFSYH